jgi:1-acyl-sn-glycerol-3-phosphate acyltransferase
LIGIYPEGTLTRDENLWPMIAKTGAARLALITKLPIIPVAAWGIGDVLAPYNKIPRIWPRSKITLRAGKPIDMSLWYGKEDDPAALAQATLHIMGELTTMLEVIRGEKRPAHIFDPHTSDLPRTGNFKKKRA